MANYTISMDKCTVSGDGFTVRVSPKQGKIFLNLHEPKEEQLPFPNTSNSTQRDEDTIPTNKEIVTNILKQYGKTMQLKDIIKAGQAKYPDKTRGSFSAVLSQMVKNPGKSGVKRVNEGMYRYVGETKE